MSRSRETVGEKRQTVVGAIIVVAFLHLVMPLIVGPLPKPERYDLFLQQDMAGYPDFVAYGFKPLDVVFSLALLALALWVVLKSLARADMQSALTFKTAIVSGLVMALIMGCAIGMFGSSLYGWYFGLMWTIAGMAATVAIVLVVSTGTALMRAISWLARSLYESYIQWWLEPPLLQLLMPIIRWFRAEDVPESSDEKQ